MKKNKIIVSFFTIITLFLVAGCTTPTVIYKGAIDDGGIHQYSQKAPDLELIYNKRAIAQLAREEQQVDLAAHKAARAIEILGNLKEHARKNGASPQDLARIEQEFWNAYEAERNRALVSAQQYDNYGYYSSSSGYPTGGGSYGTIGGSSEMQIQNGVLYPTGIPRR